jgi:hypothetical protein
MKLIIKLFGVLIILFGITLIIKPEFIFGWIENNNENYWLYIIAIIFRLGFGILFILTAKDSKYPRVIKVLGFIFILAAVIFVFTGQASFQDLVDTYIPEFKPFAVVTGILGMALGVFLIFAFSKNEDLNEI